MTEGIVRSVFEPTPPQIAFMRSDVFVRGYGGAMGGGKSRAICETGFDYALDFPGCPILVARQSHTSIVETTKKTMLEEVIPREVIASSKASQGEDYVELFNGSRIHFIGLDDPIRWFSAQIGVLIVDQVEECQEETIQKLITRLRHPKAPKGEFEGQEQTGKVLLSFNPENPDHWLLKWFIQGAEQTEFGYRKPRLFVADGEEPLGDCEFVVARATDNPHLASGYVRTLRGMSEHLRRRYLDGLWEFIGGSCYFDVEALTEYQQRVCRPKYTGSTAGGGMEPDPKGKIRVSTSGGGSLHVWKPPVRERYEDGKTLLAHRYIITVDVSSGGSTDFSAIQVLDLEEFEQVAEFQGKLDPDLLAVEAFRLGRVYNDALIAPEVTGGWGFTIVKELQRLKYPRLYTRRIEDRLTRKWTDKLGWDTTKKTRAHMLDTLERVLRERELKLYSERALIELGAFVRDDNGHPSARSGSNDDLVITLAMATALALQLPRQIRRVKPEPYVPQFAATGW